MVFTESDDVPPSGTPTLPDLWQVTLNWHPNATQVAQFQRLYEAILEGNRQLNLTRITQPLEFLEKHLWDSLSGIKPMFSIAVNLTPDPDHTALKVIDIGTGAGFPGVPVAIARPDWTVTLLDSTRKKIDFLHQLCARLNLTNVQPLVGRVEEVGQHPQHRQQYDLALIRAVAGATVCAEYALPLLALGGMAVLYRGHWTPEEQETLEQVARQLGGEIKAVEAFKTPLTSGDRHCIYLHKVAPTPASYPRAIGIPSQNPLA